MKFMTGVITGFAAAVLLLGLVESAEAAGDAASGQKIYAAKCALCHSTQDGVNRVGPSLFGIYGRVIGTGKGYSYSEGLKAMSKHGHKWDAGMLDAWIANPKAVIPGTKMVFVGIKDKKDRDDVVAYLAKLK